MALCDSAAALLLLSDAAMAPKAATDQTQTAGKEAAKTTPLLQLPDLPLGPSTNGRHPTAAAAAQQDDSAFDQDAADPLQAALGMLVYDEDGDDAEGMEDLLNLVGFCLSAPQTSPHHEMQQGPAASLAAVRGRTLC